MNIPPVNGVRVAPEDLRDFARAVLLAVGLPEADAVLLAKTLVETDQRGVLSHGTRQLPRYVRQFQEGQLNCVPQVRVVQETAATAMVDGDGGLGHFAAFRAAEVALAKAKAVGTASVVAGNHGHIGAAGTYTRLALPHGCAALCVSGVDLRTHVPFGPPRHVIQAGGGGPISFAVPAGSAPPLVVDFGCYIAHMRARLDEVFAFVPDAVLKIMGLGTITMALGGILAGVSLPPEGPARRYRGADQGTFLAVFDLSCFMPLEVFLPAMERYVREMQTLEPLPGYTTADLPGGPEWRRERAWATEGIPLSEKHLAALEEVAARCAVPLPKVIPASLPEDV